MYKDLQSFVAALEAAGELVRVREEVDPVLEIAAIADRASKARAPGEPSASAKRNDPLAWGFGGPALLFERVKGSDFPVLINAWGSYRRMEMALGCQGRASGHRGIGASRGEERGGFEAIARRIGELVKPQPPRSLSEVWERGKQLLPLLKIAPRTVKQGRCQEVVLTGEAVDLTRLPILRCWPHDGDYAALGYPAGVNDGVPGLGHPEIDAGGGDRWEREFRGRYITLAGIHTIHADDAGKPRPASHNVGMYRVQLLGKDRVAMHWHVHHDGAAHWRSWKAKGERMPVAIALGGEAVLPYAATCPLPPGISELLMAGFLNGRGIEMVPCKTVPLRAPAHAEIVIEGWVSAGAGGVGWDPRDGGEPLGPDAAFEGPFGDHTGFYSLPDRYPVVEVTAITHRRGAIYPTTIVGLPPQEDYYLGKATERIMLPLLKTIIPDIEDYDLPMFGAFHNCANIRIRKHYPLHARKVMHAVWGAGQMAWTKCVFVVGEGVDVHDPRAVLEAAARFCRPGRDLEFVNGALDILDHAAPRLGAGMKMGFDCTPKWPGEEVNGVPVGGVGGAKDGREPATAAEAAAHVERVRGVAGVVDAAVFDDAPGWLFVKADRGLHEPAGAGLGRRVLAAVLGLDPAEDGCRGVLPFAVVLGRDVSLERALTGPDGGPLFHWLANCDASRDMDLRADRDRVGFDATPKTPGDEHNGQPVRDWPPVLRMDPAAARRAAEIGKRIGLPEPEFEPLA